MTVKQKSCFNCRHLKKYTSEDRSWMNVCEAEEPEEQDGMYFVATIDTELFNPAFCYAFRQKDIS